jgi:hypothetical protein
MSLERMVFIFQRVISIKATFVSIMSLTKPSVIMKID